MIISPKLENLLYSQDKMKILVIVYTSILNILFICLIKNGKYLILGFLLFLKWVLIPQKIVLKTLKLVIRCI